jgi:type II secretory pathway component GspD/PulD (secretin)
MAGGDFTTARRLLVPLQQQPVHQETIVELIEECDARLAAAARIPPREVTARRAVDEVGERFILPDTYGQTRIIDPNTDPLEIPPGPMEEVLNRRIKRIDLDDADVTAILEALRQTEGLNLIADQALQSDQRLFIHAKDVPLRELLSYISRNMGIAFHLGESVIWVTQATAPPDNGPALETRVYELRRGYIPGAPGNAGSFDTGGDDDGGSFGSSAAPAAAGTGQDDLFEALGAFLEDNPNNPPNSKFAIYRNPNLLVVRNSRENLRLAEAIIRSFDDIPLQALIEARFITITQKDLFQLGTEIRNFSISGVKNTTIDGSLVVPGQPIAATRQLAVSGILDRLTYQMVIDALSQKSSTKTLSAPRVTVLNNQTAKIRRGDVILYFERFTVRRTVVGHNLVESLVPDGGAKRIEVGISMGATPSIGKDHKSIVLALDTAIVDFIEFVRENNVALPRTNESLLTTTVAVNSGQTVVLGGMLTASDTKSVNKIPWLGDIPVLGFLFRKTDTSDNPVHLLIFVTASIVDRDGRFNQVADELPAP